MSDLVQLARFSLPAPLAAGNGKPGKKRKKHQSSSFLFLIGAAALFADACTQEQRKLHFAALCVECSLPSQQSKRAPAVQLERSGTRSSKGETLKGGRATAATGPAGRFDALREDLCSSEDASSDKEQADESDDSSAAPSLAAMGFSAYEAADEAFASLTGQWQPVQNKKARNDAQGRGQQRTVNATPQQRAATLPAHARRGRPALAAPHQHARLIPSPAHSRLSQPAHVP